VLLRRSTPRSTSPKKNVRFRISGKPAAPPNWIAPVRRLLGGEEVCRVERLVPEVLVDGALQRVGARLQRHAHDARRRAAVLGGVAVGHHLEFLNGVHRRLHDLLLTRVAGGDLLIVVVLPVEQERHLAAGLAADD
jgi:hypothetical protein